MELLAVAAVVLAFLLWPLLIFLILYLFDRKKFKAKWAEMKEKGFFSK